MLFQRIPYTELPRPLESIPITPKQETPFFSPAVRDTVVANLQVLARRKERDLFVAYKEDGSSALGLIESHRVTNRQDDRVQLSGSFARYKLGQEVPDLKMDRDYEFLIDRSSNVILKADDPKDPPKTIGSLITSDPVEDVDSAVGAVSLEEAVRFFSIVRRQPHIPFQYPKDGCWARAHEMCRLIEKHLDYRQDSVVFKVWHYGDLAVQTENDPEGEVEWGCHVAPAVKVDSTLWMVIDPSLFDRLVTVEEWRSAQRKSPSQDTELRVTSQFVYNRDEGGALFEETPHEAENTLEENRAFLFKQIYEFGPIPYSRPQP